jgi:GntR family transcriptional regulator
MLEISVRSTAQVPLYKQIVDQIKQLVANNKLKPGERVPTVRELATNLQINPGTVARAYQELEQEGILGASRRRGTIIMGEAESPQRLPLRQSRLAGTVNNLILKL